MKVITFLLLNIFYSLLIGLNVEVTWLLLPIYTVIYFLLPEWFRQNLCWVFFFFFHVGVNFFLVCSDRVNAVWTLEMHWSAVLRSLTWPVWHHAARYTPCANRTHTLQTEWLNVGGGEGFDLWASYWVLLCFLIANVVTWLPVPGSVHLWSI